MELPQLPTCRWRGSDLSAGRFDCWSPKIIVGPLGVSAALCNQCPYVDHEPAPMVLPPLVAPPAGLSVGPVNPTRPNVVATVAVGPGGREMLDISEPFMREYAARVNADFHVIRVDESPYPLGEKFRVGSLTEHWQRVLYLDADALVDHDCPDLFEMIPPDQVGIHDDEGDVQRLAGTAWLTAEYDALAESQGFEAPARFTSCLNSGVVMFGPAHVGMWEPPTRPYPSFHCGEQHAVNLNLHRLKSPLYMLPSTLNYQWWSHPWMQGPAHVWHYAKPLDVPAAERLRRMRAHAGRLRAR